MAEALEHIKKRTGADGWQEMVFYSVYQLTGQGGTRFPGAEIWVQKALAVADRPEVSLWLLETLQKRSHRFQAWRHLQLAAALAPG